MSAFINNFYGTYIEHIDTYVPTKDHTPQQPETVDTSPTQQTSQDILPTPQEGKYTEVKTFCTNHSLRDLCTRLTHDFGWFVDENSLQRNINRNR